MHENNDGYGDKKQRRVTMKQTTIMAIALVVLLLITAVQALQLRGLKVALDEGKMTIGGSSGKVTPTASSGGSGSSAGSLPSSIQNLPSMVGGC